MNKYYRIHRAARTVYWFATGLHKVYAMDISMEVYTPLSFTLHHYFLVKLCQIEET